jgi:hypothetical protein
LACAGFDALGEIDLLRGGQQGGLSDTIEIHTDEVGSRALGVEVLGGQLRGRFDGLVARIIGVCAPTLNGLRHGHWFPPPWSRAEGDRGTLAGALGGFNATSPRNVPSTVEPSPG